jgi:signal transduction histidine kinase
MSISDRLKVRWEKAKNSLEFADIAFIVLRIVVLAGGCAWLIFSDLPKETVKYFYILFVYFAIGSTLIVFVLFISFISLLVNMTGGFDSPFSNGFYLMTALYSFYYGVVTGIVVATISIILYLLSGNFDFDRLHPWPDFSVKAVFLFLVAVPLGILSEKLKKKEDKLEIINKDLLESMSALKDLQGRVVHAEKFSALGRITADIAHEIRNPLTSIGGFARRLNKKLIGLTKEKEYTELIISEVDSLEKILKDILAFSRDAKYDLKSRDINETVKESLMMFTDIFDEQSIRVEVNLDTFIPSILIDKDHVKYTIYNLISNAVDEMPKGGLLKINTFMREMYSVNYIIVEIADTGAGIPKDKLDRIFEPFYTTKEIGKGTGLGLSLCKKIMDEHHGLIKMESELGKGTSVMLMFPYQCEEESAKIKCWEFQKCGVEKTEGAAEFRCAAYPYHGRICWVVAGTFCGKRVSGAIAQKLGDCKKCEFYKRVVDRKDL